MLIYWFLPMILFLGIVTSYEDIKFGRIRNKWILMAICYAILMYLYLFLFNNDYAPNINFLVKTALNSGLALIIGYLFWLISIWTAGDAKLFFVFTILIPINKYQNYFSFITLLMNTLIPASIFFLLHILIKTDYKDALSQLRRTFSIKTIIDIMLLIFGLSWVIVLILKLINLQPNIILILFLIFLFYYFIETILHIRILYITLTLAIARLFFDISIYSLQFLSIFLIQVLLFLILRVFIISISSKHFSKEIRFNELKEGTIPAEVIYKYRSKYLKKLARFSLFRLGESKGIGKTLFKYPSTGLTKKEIKKLISLQNKIPFKALRIQSTVPFAPFIFLGALITIIINSDIISFVKQFFI